MSPAGPLMAAIIISTQESKTPGEDLALKKEKADGGNYHAL